MKTLQKVIVMLALPLLYFLVTAAFKSPEMFKSPDVTNVIKTNASDPPVIVPVQKDFRHYILNFGYREQPTAWEIQNNWIYFHDSLSYNAIHMYDFESSRTGLFNDSLTPSQISTVNGLIDNAITHGLAPSLQRVKIARICSYGQSLTYEAEGGNDGYSFDYQITNPINDNGRMVVRACNVCGEDSPPAGYLCKDISENIQPCAIYTYPWDPPQNFHLKPEMRIDSAIVDNHPDWPVVAIVSVNFSGQRIDSTVIKARNFAQFLNGNYNYNGSYINTFDFIQEPPNTDLEISGSRTSPDGLMYGFDPEQSNQQQSQINFKIYWYGQVDVWFDKLTVQNDIGFRLLNGNHNTNYDSYLDDELSHFADRMDVFFVDECIYANYPCIKYVQDYIRANSTHAKLSYATSNWLNRYYTRNQNNTFKLYLDKTLPQIFQLDAHSFVFDDGYNPGYIPIDVFNPSKVDQYVPENWKTENKAVYNNYLQNALGNKNEVGYPSETGSLIYQINQSRTQLAVNSPASRFTIQPQIQGWLVANNITNKFRYGNREPLNQEISAEAWIALAYGADNLNWFWFPSYGLGIGPPPADVSRFVIGDSPRIAGDFQCSYGLFTTPTQPRTQNLYGQNKYEFLKQMNAKILSLKTTLDAISWNSAYSVHNEGAEHNYITDIKSIDPHRNGMNGECYWDGIAWEDCPYDRYWEMGFYNTVGTTKYFVMVNRRCIPESVNPDPNKQYAGDDRVLKINFDESDFPIYTTWQISEVGNNTTAPVTFSKNFSGYVDLGSNNGSMGWFKPGEGKLFKIEPVLPKGGILAGDEDLSDVSFTCEAPVYNNGYNITIGANTTIHFNDSSRFVMNGGVFTVGDQNTTGSQNITSDAVSGNTWLGHSFTNCEVNIYGATFTGLKNDTTYALNFIDCPVVDIRGCTFNTNSSLNGAINTVCYSNPFLAINNIYIGGNTFNGSGSTIPTVNVSSYAGITTPLIIENNTFNEGNTAIFLSGVTGGAIKDNIITDNYIGINALTSSIDIAENTISSTISESIGIFSAGGSEIRLGSAGKLEIGGNNSITNTGERSNNIKVDGSYFLLADGQNIFDIASNQAANHLTGYFPYFTAVSYDEHDNCFKVDNTPVNPPVNSVTDGYQGSAITFTFSPYLTGCEVNQCEDYISINLGGGVNDTICNGLMGSGGGENNRLPLTKGEYPQGEGVLYTTLTTKEKYDSLCVLMRYRNYSQAKTKCLDLINTFPDSIQSLNAVSKLFLSTVATDTSYNAANELKTYYENLILNHGSNVSLVKRVNYYILKCKVRMREYSQALAGFQQIINLNPYSYEGLIARWDYMATSLLVQGQGGGFSSIDNNQLTIDNQSNESFEFEEFDKSGDDKNPFTKEQRQDIRKSINIAIEISKSDDESKMKTLEEKSQLGDVNASRELVQLKTLKQVVKTEKPKNIMEHVKIVSEDIRKVFGSNTSSKGNEPKNIPSVFRLSQNYPNPFNPTTKINYDLPRDSKVNIVIYDILGREVKRLVNNDLKTAGSYIIDFNASNYASGVYFYRIEAEEPNGSKFVDSKKMVLLK